MRTFLAKCSAVALIAGGFALTGDAGRLLARGRGVIDATTIPQTAAASPAAPAPAVAAAPSDKALPANPAPSPSTTPPPAPSTPDHPADAPVGSTPSRSLPEGPDLASVQIATLAPGDRILVWIGSGSARSPAASVAYDLVDPATGDVIEVRHASGDDPLPAHAPRRRVRLEGSVRQGMFTRAAGEPASGRIEVAAGLRVSPVEPRGGAARADAAETIGPVSALRVVRAPGAIP